jgi:hypothetical protein
MRWIKDYWGILVAVVAAIVYVVLRLLEVDFEAGPPAVLLVASSLGLWLLWKYWSVRRAIKVLVTIAIVVADVGLMYCIYLLSQPRFEIEAFETLPGDNNAYELTDQLIDNHDRLDEYGVVITFTLQIRPIYEGKQQFGRAVAIVSGKGGTLPPKLVWHDFSSESKTATIHLTLTDLLEASGLEKNSDPPVNPFRPGGPHFQQAKLIVQIARAVAPGAPWASEEITIRNAPWESRSDMVWRNGRCEVDVYLRNLGGAGDFTFRYQLVRLDEEINSSPYPMSSGTTYVTAWYEPTDLIRLNAGDFFTDTVSVPDDLIPGRYLLEVYPIKKQEYVTFESGATWEDLEMETPWWFGGSPKRKHLFVTPESPVAPIIRAEWEQLDDQGIDLGIALKPAEAVTSATGATGQHQVFQKGEIYVHDGQSYAIYGSILDHYLELGGVRYDRLGFPVSPIQAVTSTSGTEGTMMEFEGQGSPHPLSAIYASRKGVAAASQWIRLVYSEENGGHSGWLGFPLADEQNYTDSTIQMFEYGYVVYSYPFVGEDRDWGRPPVAYPYLASRGTLFDVHAGQSWQDTGVQVQPEDRVTIVQVGGAWTHYRWGVEVYDANGFAGLTQDDTQLPSVPVGTLIVRMGEDDAHMLSVGRWSVLTAPAEGTLYLAMNDNNYEDNAGFITVQIVVEHSE